MSHLAPVDVGGPYFDELTVGQVFDAAPAVTLTDGMAAVHQSILGDRLRLPLDRELAVTVAGGPVAHPCLVTDVAIGQSTLATHHVKANLFYRGLQFHRFPLVGDTLHTVSEVVGLKSNSVKPGRAATGLAALHMRTHDQRGNTILDFYRCAMLPLDPSTDPTAAVRTDDLSSVGPGEPPARSLPTGLDLAAYRERVPGRHFDDGIVGAVFSSSGDVVTGAPELARLTLNIAATHHDERVGTDGRLVYGGHTIGIALAQATRALPDMVTVLGWQSCDHTGPVHEYDTLTSRLHVVGATPLPDGGIYDLRSLVYAHRPGSEPAQVLDWRFTAVMARR